MIQLLIGIGIALIFIVIVYFTGIVTIGLINMFTLHNISYYRENIFNYGWKGIGVFFAIIVGLVVIWGIGDIVLTCL